MGFNLVFRLDGGRRFRRDDDDGKDVGSGVELATPGKKSGD